MLLAVEDALPVLSEGAAPDVLVGLVAAVPGVVAPALLGGFDVGPSRRHGRRRRCSAGSRRRSRSAPGGVVARLDRDRPAARALSDHSRTSPLPGPASRQRRSPCLTVTGHCSQWPAEAPVFALRQLFEFPKAHEFPKLRPHPLGRTHGPRACLSNDLRKFPPDELLPRKVLPPVPLAEPINGPANRIYPAHRVYLRGGSPISSGWRGRRPRGSSCRPAASPAAAPAAIQRKALDSGRVDRACRVRVLPPVLLPREPYDDCALRSFVCTDW